MKKSVIILMVVSMIMSSSSFAYANDALFDVPETDVKTEITEEITEDPQTEPENNEAEASDTKEDLADDFKDADGASAGDSADPSSSVIKQKVVRLILGSDSAYVNGVKIKLDTPAESIDGRTFLPLRFISENLLEVNPVFDSATKTLKIVNKEKTVSLTIGSKEAIVNSEKVQLDGAPVVKNGSTLLPLRFFVDNYDMTISYDPAKKEVTIKKTTGINNLPSADFEFARPSYIAGQKIEYTDKSSDPDNDSIVAHEFMTSLDSVKKSADINQLLSKAPAGEYEVRYRVQDSQLDWSKWISKTLVIEKNEPPVIESVSMSKSAPGRGESFDMTFEYSNEDWEKIIKEEWSYRHESQGPSQARKEKPSRIFTTGDYVVTLKLTDAYGNVSEAYEKTVKISDRIVQTQFEYLSASDPVNSELENYDNKDYNKLFQTMSELKFIDIEGTLIMSDSPENVYDYGILYEETTDLDGRILLYHVNKIPSPRNSGAGLLITVENTDDKPVRFSLEKTGMKGPSTDPLAVGTKVLEAHFSPGNTYGAYDIKPGEKVSVCDSRGNINWKPDHLVSMLSEYKTTGKVKITIYSVGPNTGMDHLGLLTYLPKDQHPRGTFNITHRNLSVNVPAEIPTSIVLGGKETEWITGDDGITGETVINRGNYGVEYRVSMTPEEDTLVFLNARGGPFKGIVGWIDGNPRYVNSYYMSSASYVGKIPAGKTSTMRYMLPNGSSAPVIIGFVPEAQWNA